MEIENCKKNNIITIIFEIVFEIIFIFMFLTIFYFAYVIKVEKEEFQTQINFLIDSIYRDIQEQIIDIYKPNTDFIMDEDSKKMLISGIIAILEEKVNISTLEQVKKTLKDNQKVTVTAFKYLGFTLLGMIILCSIMLLIGYCINIKKNIKASLFTIFFVCLVELLFLHTIAKNYISADPNTFKRNFAISVQNWIKTNKKLDNNK